MNASILSIKLRNIYGNIATGACLIALGMTRAIAPTSSAALGCAALLLVLAGFNLRACLSGSREREDEMSKHNAGNAASFALWSTLIAMAIACAVGMVLGLSVDLASASCFAIGLAMVVYGASFAKFEQGE